jgi:hypothetical protein
MLCLRSEINYNLSMIRVFTCVHFQKGGEFDVIVVVCGVSH